MHPKEHIIYGGLFAIICFFLFDIIGLIEALIIWVSSWFIIDLDHAIRYSVKTGNFNIVKFCKWSKKRGEVWKLLPGHKKKEHQHPIFIFHGIEALIILFLLGLIWNIFNWILIGFIFHLILDLVSLYIDNENVLYKMSVILVFFRNRGKIVF